MMHWEELIRDTDGSGSHLPVFDLIFGIRPIKRVLEFGMGGFSSPFFVSKGVELVSVDTEQQWIDKFFDKNNPKHKGYLYSFNDMETILEKELGGKIFDIIFIDADYRTRKACLQKSFGRSEIIVCHDTQRPGHYKWNEIKVPDNYKEVIFKFTPSWTTVFVSHLAFYESLARGAELLQKYHNFYYEIKNWTDRKYE